jgi:hypothetical protein
MSTILAVDGISSRAFLYPRSYPRLAPEAAHVPLDYVVVMVPEIGGCMTRPTPDGSLRTERGSELVGNGSLPRWNGRNDSQNRTFQSGVVNLNRVS